MQAINGGEGVSTSHWGGQFTLLIKKEQAILCTNGVREGQSILLIKKEQAILCTNNDGIIRW